MKNQIIAVAVVIALLAAACGNDNSESAPPTPAPTSAATAQPALAPTSTPTAAATPLSIATPTPDLTSAPTAPPTPAPTSAATAPPTATAIEPIDRLRIHHPETLAFAAPFTVLDTSGALADVADEISTSVWNTPDVLRSILVNGDTEVAAVPSYVGANLFNRGVDIRMAAVVVWGLIWLIGPEGTPATWESLRGQTVMIPFPNDMPDLVFQYLSAANGLTSGEDFDIEYYAQPPEIIGQLVAGNGSWAVLPEHVVTLALARANQNGQALGRVFDLQTEWAAAAGTSPRIPQAGIVVRGEIAADHPGVLAALLDDLSSSVEVVNAAAPDTLAVLSETSGVPAPVIEQVIPRLNLEVVPAAEAQDELERFFTELATLSPDIIGDRLPDPSFYLADPR